MSDGEKKILIISIVLVVAAVAGLALAFTGPSQPPPGGSSQYWQLNGSNLGYTTGNVGISTSTPAYKLDINGNIYASGSLRGGTGICLAGSCKTSFSTIPSGLILFFNLPSCPSGWSEVTTTRGKYLVGLPSGGTLAGTAGTALSNLENRPVGQHTHTANNSPHSHTLFHEASIGLAGTDFQQPSSTLAFHYNETSNNAYTGITLANSGTVAGTNAPYTQLLVCQKN